MAFAEKRFSFEDARDWFVTNHKPKELRSKIYNIQESLVSANCLSSKDVSGQFDVKTYEAIKMFQKKYCLEQTGIWTSQTRIYDVQECLVNAKCLSSKDVSGQLDIETGNAIKKFQKKYGLEQNGVLTDETRSAMAYDSKYRSTNRDDPILGLQNLLMVGGYLQTSKSKDILGRFNPETQEAIEKFQKKYGIGQGGKFDLDTYYALEFEIKYGKGKVGDLANTMKSFIAAKAWFERHPKDVACLDQRLAKLGYLTEPLSYSQTLSDSTFLAICALQRDAHIVQDGKWGPQTEKAAIELERQFEKRSKFLKSIPIREVS